MANRKRNRKPTHPGKILQECYLTPLGLTISKLANELGLALEWIEKFVAEKKSITPETAALLASRFNTTVELWLNLQEKHDAFKAGAVNLD